MREIERAKHTKKERERERETVIKTETEKQTDRQKVPERRTILPQFCNSNVDSRVIGSFVRCQSQTCGFSLICNVAL